MAGEITTYGIPQDRTAARWGDLRPVERKSAANALAALPLARSAMMATRSTMACFHIAVSGRARNRATLWKRRPDGAYEIIDADGHVNRRVIDEICGGMAGAAREISKRWPERARPGVIGLATDGHLIAFNPGQPSCVGVAWLDDHVTGQSPATIVVNDGNPGYLTIMSNDQGMH